MTARLKCQLCGAHEESLRQVDEPLDLTYQKIRRKLPKGAQICVRHFADFRGKPGSYIFGRDLVATR